MSLVFHDNGQRLAIPRLFFWSGQQKVTAAKLLANQIHYHHIMVRETAWAAYKRSKNTRVRQ